MNVPTGGPAREAERLGEASAVEPFPFEPATWITRRSALGVRRVVRAELGSARARSRAYGTSGLLLDVDQPFEIRRGLFGAC